MRHLQPGTAVPSFVETPAYFRIKGMLDSVVPYSDVGAVVGKAGVGKSFLTEELARRTGKEVIYVHLPGKPSQSELLVRFLRELTGKVLRAERYILSTQIEDHLAGRDCICIIDEVQGLQDINLDQLSHLHGQPTARWSLIMVGGLKVKDRLEKYEHLSSRVHQIVTVNPLTGEDLIESVRALHPVFAHAPYQLLQKIDLEYGGGRLRNWARFLRGVSDLQDKLNTPLDTLDEQVAAAVTYMIEGDTR